MKQSLLFLFTLLTNLVFGQNLISDPSFEIHGKLDSAVFFNDVGSVWTTPLYTTPDYFSKDRTGIFGQAFGAPKSFVGYQDPHSGNSYAGMTVI